MDENLTAERTGLALMELVSSVPVTNEPVSSDPRTRSTMIVRKYCLETAALDFTSALPPGPLSWLTLLPALVGVWRLQAQMVSDIASCYGKSKILGSEQMLYCLFRHATGHLLRDIVTRVGSRLIVKRVALKGLQKLLRALGIRVTQRVIGRGLARTIPILGAVAIAAYAFYDTSNVGKTTIEFFSKEVEVSDEEIDEFEGA